VHGEVGSARPLLPPYGGNAQLGCGLAVRRIRNRRYLYFWAYARTPSGSRRRWTYVGPVGRPGTHRKAADLLLEYHVKLRREVERRIARLLTAHAAFG